MAEAKEPGNRASRHMGARGWFFVVFQECCFAIVVIPYVLGLGPVWYRLPWLETPMILAGLAGMAWSFSYLRGASSPNPVPNRAGLVAGGPFRFARHPMYTFILVVCLGITIGGGQAVSYLGMPIVLAAVYLKTRYEERRLVEAYPEYVDYAVKTGMYVPGIGKWTPKRRSQVRGPGRFVT